MVGSISRLRSALSMVPCVTCTTGRSADSSFHHGGATKSSAGSGLTAPTNRTWSGRSLRWYSNSGIVGTISRSASTAESSTNTGSFGRPSASSMVSAALCDGRSRTFVRRHVQHAVAQPAERARARQDAGAAGRGVPAGQEQRSRGVGQDRRPRRALVEQHRQDAEEEGVGDDGVEVVCGHQLLERRGLMRQWPDEDVLDVEVDPRDARRLGAAGQVGVERRVVVVRAVGQRVRGRARRTDLVGMPRRGQEA